MKLGTKLAINRQKEEILSIVLSEVRKSVCLIPVLPGAFH
jgi:hypothetical protein